jgi:hypothetical protein
VSDDMLSKLARAAEDEAQRMGFDMGEVEAGRLVKAILESLSSPTEGMRHAANKVEIEREVNGDDLTFYATGYEATDIWQAMLSHVLNERGEG